MSNLWYFLREFITSLNTFEILPKPHERKTEINEEAQTWLKKMPNRIFYQHQIALMPLARSTETGKY